MEKDYIVGDTFQFGMKTWLVCLAENKGSCLGCDGKGHTQKALCELLPPCYSSIRKDATDVIFKIIA